MYSPNQGRDKPFPDFLMPGRCFLPLHGPNFIKFYYLFDLHLGLEFGGETCPKCCSRQGPEAICDVSNMLQKGTKRCLQGSKNDYGRVPKTTKTRHPKRSKMWFPSRTGGTLSPKSDLRDVYNIVQKRSQKGSKKVPQQCSKRYVYCGFYDFTTFQKGSKKVPKTT